MTSDPEEESEAEGNVDGKVEDEAGIATGGAVETIEEESEEAALEGVCDTNIKVVDVSVLDEGELETMVIVVSEGVGELVGIGNNVGVFSDNGSLCSRLSNRIQPGKILTRLWE